MTNVRIAALFMILLGAAGVFLWYRANLEPSRTPSPGGNPRRYTNAAVQEMKAMAKMSVIAPTATVPAVPSQGKTAAAKAANSAAAAKAAGAAAALDAKMASPTGHPQRSTKHEKLVATQTDLKNMLEIMKSWSRTAAIIPQEKWWPDRLHKQLNLSASTKPEWRLAAIDDLTQKLTKITRRMAMPVGDVVEKGTTGSKLDAWKAKRDHAQAMLKVMRNWDRASMRIPLPVDKDEAWPEALEQELKNLALLPPSERVGWEKEYEDKLKRFQRLIDTRKPKPPSHA